MKKRFDVVDVAGMLLFVGVGAFAALWWAHTIGDFLINN